MMIVVAVIGIMAAIGIPSFRGLMPRIKLSNSAMILSNEIALARVRAISKSYDFRIEFDPGAESYTISKFNGTWQSLGATTISPTDLTSAVILPATALIPANTLYFAGNGQVTNVPLGQKAAIELRTADGDDRKRIIVEPTGRMSVERWGNGGWVED